MGVNRQELMKTLNNDIKTKQTAEEGCIYIYRLRRKLTGQRLE